MTEREAEAEQIILALGPQLEWEDLKDGAFACEYWRARNSTGFYDVWHYVDYEWIAVHYDRHGTKKEIKREFKTADQAKAACEMHTATGNWT